MDKDHGRYRSEARMMIIQGMISYRPLLYEAEYGEGLAELTTTHEWHLRHLGHLTALEALQSLHHLAGLGELREELIDILYARPTPECDALTAMTIEDMRLSSLLGRHRVDDSFDALEGIVLDIDILERLPDTRDHRSEILDVTHLLDLLDLGEEVIEVKLILSDTLLEALSFALIVELLGTLDK